MTFELQSEEPGDGLSTGEGQGVDWEEAWPRGDPGWAPFPALHSSSPSPPRHPPFSLLPSLLFSLLDMLSSHGNFDHPEMNRGVSPQQASPGGACWLVFRHQANLIGFYGKLAQRWVLAHCRSQPSCSGTWWYCGGGGIRFRVGTLGLWGA